MAAGRAAGLDAGRGIGRIFIDFSTLLIEKGDVLEDVKCLGGGIQFGTSPNGSENFWREQETAEIGFV